MFVFLDKLQKINSAWIRVVLSYQWLGVPIVRTVESRPRVWTTTFVRTNNAWKEFHFFFLLSSNSFFTARKEVWGNVIFSVACVKNSVYRGRGLLPQCMLGYHPPGPKHPPQSRPPGTPCAVHAGRYSHQAGGSILLECNLVSIYFVTISIFPLRHSLASVFSLQFWTSPHSWASCFSIFLNQPPLGVLFLSIFLNQPPPLGVLFVSLSLVTFTVR